MCLLRNVQEVLSYITQLFRNVSTTEGSGSALLYYSTVQKCVNYGRFRKCSLILLNCSEMCLLEKFRTFLYYCTVQWCVDCGRFRTWTLPSSPSTRPASSQSPSHTSRPSPSDKERFVAKDFQDVSVFHTKSFCWPINSQFVFLIFKY